MTTPAPQSTNTTQYTSQATQWKVVGAGVGLAVVTLVITLLLASPKQPPTPKDAFGPLPDFASIQDVAEMKAAFFDYLEPIARHHNAAIAKDRALLLGLQKSFIKSQKLTPKAVTALTALASEYDYPLDDNWRHTGAGNEDSQAHINRIFTELLARVDTVPIDLVLTQAAKESGWGRSRFAVEANNLFGQWCYSEGCGLVPSQRKAGASHEVAKFATPSDAVASYIRNLNTHPSYKSLREIRATLRRQQQKVNGHALADGLLFYSERREAYVNEVKAMLNGYHQFQQNRAATQ